MDLIEAVNRRKAIRAFKPDPVPKDILEDILEKALRAPSWANTQPWEFAIVTGDKLKEIEKGFVEKGQEPVNPDIARPQDFPEPYSSRRPPPPKDVDTRRIQNFKHYGAPACIYLLVGRSFFFQPKGINIWPLYDCGSVAQNIMLLATGYGLGTIAQAQSVAYPDVIRRVVGIPESKLIALGISIGYPDWDDPVNQSWTTREPLSKVATWHGFD